MTKRNKYMIISGIILALCGIIIGISEPDSPPTSIIVLNIGLVFIITALVRHLKFGTGIERDERTDKISFTSLAASFQITLFCLMLLWWIDYAIPLPISISNLIGLIIIFMAVVQIVMQIYYSRKINL